MFFNWNVLIKSQSKNFLKIYKIFSTFQTHCLQFNYQTLEHWKILQKFQRDLRIFLCYSLFACCYTTLDQKVRFTDFILRNPNNLTIGHAFYHLNNNLTIGHAFYHLNNNLTFGHALNHLNSER